MEAVRAHQEEVVEVDIVVRVPLEACIDHLVEVHIDHLAEWVVHHVEDIMEDRECRHHHIIIMEDQGIRHRVDIIGEPIRLRI